MSPIRIATPTLAVLGTAICAGLATPAPAADNNLNPTGSLCLDLRWASPVGGGAGCVTDGDCPAGLQCTDTDGDPLNGGMCMEQGCYALNEELVVDLELGATDEPVCGIQSFLEYDTEVLELLDIEVDPDSELGMVAIFAPMVDPQAGTIDLHIALPLGTKCDGDNGSVDGGTVARLTFLAVGECDTAVSFRPHNPPTAIAGASGTLPLKGCDGASSPSGTDDMQVTAPPAWTCPADVTLPADCAPNTAEVFFDPITVTDTCDDGVQASSACAVTYFLPCNTDNDCLGSGPCDGHTCASPVEPAGVDLQALVNGGGTFLAGRTTISCSATNTCLFQGACEVTIDVLSSLMEPADCADNDADGIRDDTCMWWGEDSCSCWAMPTNFGDIGGPLGDCMPDGTTDANDRFHALNCFSNIDTGGELGYPCEPQAPAAYNVDPGGPFGDCQPDGVCDANDAIHVINTFEGASFCNCPGAGPAPDLSPLEIVGRTPLRALASRRVIRPGEVVAVDVLTARALADLRAYQLHLVTSGGTRGSLELVDISIHQPDVVSGSPKTLDQPVDAQWSAFNLATGQMAAGRDSAGVPAPAGAYLATFTYRASAEASGVFSIDVQRADGSREGGRTFLMPTAPRQAIELEGLSPAVVIVRPRGERSVRR